MNIELMTLDEPRHVEDRDDGDVGEKHQPHSHVAQLEVEPTSHPQPRVHNMSGQTIIHTDSLKQRDQVANEHRADVDHGCYHKQLA